MGIKQQQNLLCKLWNYFNSMRPELLEDTWTRGEGVRVGEGRGGRKVPVAFNSKTIHSSAIVNMFQIIVFQSSILKGPLFTLPCHGASAHIIDKLLCSIQLRILPHYAALCKVLSPEHH